MIDIPGIYVGRFKEDPNNRPALMTRAAAPTYTDDNWANVESTGTIWRYNAETGEWVDTGLEEILVEEVTGTKAIVAEGTVPWNLQGLKVYGKSTQDDTPSPESPVPIVSAGDDGEIGLQITGKNLLDQTKLALEKYNIYYGYSFDDVQFNLIAGINYTLSVPDDVTLPTGIFFNNMANTHLVFSFNSRSVSFKPDKNIEVKLEVYWAKGRPENATKLQLEVGPTATPYEPYKSQSLTISTPSGMPGIPVDSGGNYTDADGQHWVCDEVDFEKGVYRKTVGVIENYQSESVNEPYMSTTGQLSIGAKVIYPLSQQEETPLTNSQLQAYKALMSYDGTTVISTDEDISGMSAKVVTDVISKNEWFDPYAELALYYKALAGFESLDNLPMPHSRESSLVRKLLDSSYELGFSINENSSRNERYLWDLINKTSEMLTNIPKSDTEKFLHVMIGGTVEEYPVVDTELDYWMDKCVNYMNTNGNIGE